MKITAVQRDIFQHHKVPHRMVMGSSGVLSTFCIYQDMLIYAEMRIRLSERVRVRVREERLRRGKKRRGEKKRGEERREEERRGEERRESREPTTVLPVNGRRPG
uniref:Uncharacterized protein n=1 Tax=Vespula pensylvanica TaxID=30213 RepID=A0A834KLN4_VESPE|nr:hypothetical protein H0235_013855 [Vespula pensylvanica]